MAGHGFVMFGWSWIEAGVLGSQVFGQGSTEGCDTVSHSQIETQLYCLTFTLLMLTNTLIISHAKCNFFFTQTKY